jgi:hypothetical protein
MDVYNDFCGKHYMDLIENLVRILLVLNLRTYANLPRYLTSMLR